MLWKRYLKQHLYAIGYFAITVRNVNAKDVQKTYLVAKRYRASSRS
jgi:hypothetical protein